VKDTITPEQLTQIYAERAPNSMPSLHSLSSSRFRRSSLDRRPASAAAIWMSQSIGAVRSQSCCPPDGRCRSIASARSTTMNT
jgi:hypothetical protein